MKTILENSKTNAQRFITILFVSVAPFTMGVLLSGCAGDRYHESTGESIDDTAITARVKSALGGDPQFKYDNVHVTTFKGTVQMSGFVVTRDARSHAEELARNADGVKGVTDNIDVRD